MIFGLIRFFFLESSFSFFIYLIYPVSRWRNSSIRNANLFLTMWNLNSSGPTKSEWRMANIYKSKSRIIQRNECITVTAEREIDIIPFDGWLRFAADSGFEFDVVKLNALHILRFLHNLRHLFLSCKLTSRRRYKGTETLTCKFCRYFLQ